MDDADAVAQKIGKLAPLPAGAGQGEIAVAQRVVAAQVARPSGGEVRRRTRRAAGEEKMAFPLRAEPVCPNGVQGIRKKIAGVEAVSAVRRIIDDIGAETVPAQPEHGVGRPRAAPQNNAHDAFSRVSRICGGKIGRGDAQTAHAGKFQTLSSPFGQKERGGIGHGPEALRQGAENAREVAMDEQDAHGAFRREKCADRRKKAVGQAERGGNSGASRKDAAHRGGTRKGASA